MPASRYAKAAARRVASSVWSSARSSRDEVSVAAPRPTTRTSWRSQVSTIAAAPSQMGEQSFLCSGVATGRFLLASK